MSSFTVSVPSSVISAAFKCLSDPNDDPRPLTNHVLFFDGACVSTNGALLLKQRLHDVPDFPPFGISRNVARVLLLAYDNMFTSFEVTVTPASENGEKTRVHVALPDGLRLGELIPHDLPEMVKSARAGIRAAVGEMQQQGVSKAAFRAELLQLIGEIGVYLNPTHHNTVGVEIWRELKPAVFSLNENASIVLMPTIGHTYSSVFAGDVESESEKSND